MDINQLLAKYNNNQSEIARRFGVTRAYVSRWVKEGRVPERFALRELTQEVVEELQAGEQNRSTQRLIRKIKSGLRPMPDAEGL
jgi:predicted transcriptional regulator